MKERVLGNDNVSDPGMVDIDFKKKAGAGALRRGAARA
jgi:hypothetical protein